ncbi:MAG: endo-1,4-beta-xylanase [Defluviitaleaceae bacterium]|nr:endo-1,4-beta-xylanase [Defluviitaleaceae bacterium]
MAKWDLSLPALCKVFEKNFKVGNIVKPQNLDDADFVKMYKHHYNSVTAENAMKPESVSSKQGVYEFEHSDKIVDWAVKNDLQIIGHTFIWHAQSALWLNRNEDETPITRAEARANMEAFIKEYGGRYSGKIHSWDVINEAFIDSSGDKPYSGNWREYIRRETDNPRAVGHWFLAYANGADASKGECGTDYVFDSFYFARKYDPKAILYYNDYNEEFAHKCVAITDMVNDINKQWRNHPEYDNRLLIEGIGMQSHHNHIHTNVATVRAALERFIQTGAIISITEMDFTFGSSEEPSAPLSAEESKKQAEMYTELFKLYIEYSKHIERVTFWGTDDKQSWRAWGSPLFFDTDFQAKEAFYSVIKLATNQ